MKFSECFYQISFIVEVNAVKVRFTHFSCRQNVYFLGAPRLCSDCLHICFVVVSVRDVQVQ